VNATQTQLQGRLRCVYRHFPLTTVHPQAQPAAEAAEAAHSQQKFWSMHDTLFTAEASLAPTLFAAAAATGINVPAFHTEITRRVHVPRIRADASVVFGAV
jgi:protein-disulfide isomerase